MPVICYNNITFNKSCFNDDILNIVNIKQEKMEKDNLNNLKSDIKKLFNIVLEEQSSYLHDVLSCLYNFNLKVEYRIKSDFNLNVLKRICDKNNIQLINDIPDNLIEDNSIHYYINNNILTLTVNHIYFDINQINLIFNNIKDHLHDGEDLINIDFVKTKNLKDMHDLIAKFYKREKYNITTINNIKEIDNFFDKKALNYLVVDSKKINVLEKNKKGYAA